MDKQNLRGSHKHSSVVQPSHFVFVFTFFEVTGDCFSDPHSICIARGSDVPSPAPHGLCEGVA